MKFISIILFICCCISNIYSQKECNVTYVSNEGFLVETAGKKVLIDALFDNIDGNWCDSPSDSILDLLNNAKAPFNDVDIIAVTHHHRDHFNEKVVVNHLLSNKKATVICPEQVDKILSENEHYENFRNRIISITPPLFCDSSILVTDIQIRILRLEHSHFMKTDTVTGEPVNKHRNVENIGFVISINGINIFHCGDTNPLNEEEYSAFALQNEELDLALVERMFFSRGQESIDILNTYINPKQIILMHINPANKELFAGHFKDIENIKVFMNKMESKNYTLK